MKPKVLVTGISNAMYEEPILIQANGENIQVTECSGGPTTNICGALKVINFLASIGMTLNTVDWQFLSLNFRQLFMNDNLSFWQICGMLWRWYEWRKVKGHFGGFSKIIHDTGYWYYTGLNCIVLRSKRGFNDAYRVNSFGYLIFIFLCLRLEWKLKKFNK